jgi:hypothetical protein
MYTDNTFLMAKVFERENNNLDFISNLLDVKNNPATLLNLKDLYYYIKQKNLHSFVFTGIDVIAIGLFDFFSSKNDNVIVYEVAI